MYGLKCLIAEAIDSASISHGNHVTRRPPSLALKKPASFSLPFCMAYIVAPMPHSLTNPSTSYDLRPTAHLPVVAELSTCANILYAPMNERIDFTVYGLSQLANVPRFHTQPSITVFDGQMVVFAADKRRPLLDRHCTQWAHDVF